MVRFAALLLAFACALAAHAETVTVFAAASLKESLDDLARTFERTSGHRVVVSYAGSNALARQIENGAPADLFISADLEWSLYLEKRGLAAPGSQREFLANDLVLVAPARSNLQVKLARGVNLTTALGDRRIAIANPDVVPAGKYAKAALMSLNAWNGLEPHLARTDNVRMALALVARGEVPMGIVYRTDALAEPKVRVVDAFPPESHAPIVYPMLLLKRTDAATALSLYLVSPAGRTIFEKYGFRAR